VSAVEGATCPLCGQPLATHDRARLQVELDQELQGLEAHYSANKDRIAAISKRLTELERQLRQIRDAEEKRRTLQRQADQLDQQIDAAAERMENWQKQRAPRLEEIQALLARDEILPAEQAELVQVKAAITQLGYDRATHLQLARGSPCC